MRVTIGIALSLLLAGCVRSHEHAPVRDADVATDGGRDSGGVLPRRDGGIAGGTDAGIDAGSDPSWHAVFGERGCVVELARDPAAFVPALEAGTCDDGAPGCRRLRMPGGLVTDRSFRGLSGTWDATTGSGSFAWRSPRYATRTHELGALADESGAPRVVWRVPAGVCRVAAARVDVGRVALTISYGIEVAPLDDDLPPFVIEASLDRPESARLLASVEGGSSWAGLRDLFVTTDGIALQYPRRWIDRDGRVLTVAPTDDRTIRKIDDAHAARAFLTVTPRVWGDPYRIVVWSAMGERELLPPLAGGERFDVRTDGVDLVWYQAYRADPYARDPDRVELWTSPHGVDATSLAPRRLATLEAVRSYRDTDVAAGRAIALDARGYVVLPIDGSPARVLRHPGGDFVRLLYAGADELVVERIDGVRRHTVELRFYRYDELPLLE